jgi:hypothetical protein
VNLKAALKISLYLCLSIASLLVLAFVGVLAFMRWEYHLPSDQKARQQFEEHKAEFVRFASMLRRDERARVIDRNGVDDAFEKDARAVPEYRDLMRSIGAKAVYVRPDGSIEFELWGFGCAPCSDSFKGMRYSPIGAKEQGGLQWVPKLVHSLDNESLPKEKGAVADGLYVVPLESEWSIYRLEISD